MTVKQKKQKVKSEVNLGQWLSKVTNDLYTWLVFKIARKIAKKRGEDIYIVRDEGILKLIGETHYLLYAKNLVGIAYFDE